MAGLTAIHAVTSGLAQYLTRAHQLSPISGTSCTFSAVGTTELQQLNDDATTVSLYLYRVAINEHTRNRLGSRESRPPFTVNLHLMLTVWADTAQTEQILYAWVLRELTRLAVLDRSVLGNAASFDVAELVQLTFDDISLDDASRLWQVLAPPYRLSTTFVARNVRIDHEDTETFAPVVATRLGFSTEVEGA
jgi:hypothetical protein